MRKEAHIDTICTPLLVERLRQLSQIKHKTSRSRRVTSIERRIGEIKRELSARQKIKGGSKDGKSKFETE